MFGSGTMERALRQTPGPYPGGAAWSKLGLLAIGLEKAVVIVSPNDLEHGDAGHVVLGDDTSSGAGDLGSVFPACIVGNARTPGAIHCRPLLRRGSRPEVTARCVAWSPVFDEPNNKHTRPPRCALVVVSTSHAVSVHAQSTLGTTSEWLEVCDLAKLEREALETETENESAPNAFAKGPAPAPRAPVDLSNAVVSVLTRASAAARPAPALPPTPATAARAPIRRQLPAPTPTPKPQKPPPSNALAPGVRAKTRRGSTTGSWRPGTVTFVISEYVFRVKVRYDDDDEFDNNDNNDKNELKETWLAWDEAPPVFVELGENGDPLAFAATCSSAFEFPPSTSSSGHWLCLGSPRPANTTGEAVAKTSSYAVHDQTCKTDKNGFVPAKPETEEALVRLGSVSDADLDDAPTATKKKTLAPAKAKAKKPPVAKIPPVDLAAPLAADGLAKTGTYENAIAACAAARVAVANKQTVLRFVETTAPSGTLGLDAAVALATDAVFATAPPSLELVTQAFDVLAKKTQNFAISKLALRVADAFMAARYGLGIDTTYAKGKHVVGDDKACLSKTFESAFLKILKIGKQGKQGGAEAKQTELTKSELKKVCFKQARELVNVTAETKETTDCGTNRATTRGGKAPTNAIALSSDSDEDGLPRVLDSDAEFVVKPAASQTPRFPAPRKRKQPDSQTLFATGTAVCASKNIRLANRLAALCVAWRYVLGLSQIPPYMFYL